MNRIMKLSSLVCLIFLLSSVTLMAQSKKKQVENAFNDRSRFSGVHLGGYVMASYNNGWQLDISPSVGYRIKKWLIMGGGFNYSYASRFDFRQRNDKLTTTISGPKAFAKVNVGGGFYGLGEYQYTTHKFKYEDATGTSQQVSVNYCEDNPGSTTCVNKHENVVYLGAGQTSNFGNGFGMYSEIVLDILYDKRKTTRPAPYALRLGLFYTFP